MLQPIEISAPGSAMLFGEHAVLREHPAIVCAIDCRLSICIRPNDKNVIQIHSSFGSTESPLHLCHFEKPFHFIGQSCKRLLPISTSGYSISVSSNINPTVGLGSSASVTVATLAAIYALFTGSIDPYRILSDSIAVIQSIQGFGSGADAASIIFGGVISYQQHTSHIEKLTTDLPIHLLYSGSKTPTAEVISFVNEREKKCPKLYETIFSSIAIQTDMAKKAICERNLPLLGDLMNQAQGSMQTLGVCNKNLLSIYTQCLFYPSIYGAKISGSGLGDCIVALGTLPENAPLYRVPSKISAQGLLRNGLPL